MVFSRHSIVGRSVIAIGVAISSLSAVAAQSGSAFEIRNPRGTIENFDTEHLGPVLTDLGIAWAEQVLPTGGRYLKAAVGTSFTFQIVPAACTDKVDLTGCTGMSLVALYEGDGVNYQTVSAFNQRYGFTSAGVLGGGRDAFLSRYEIADYGIARGNIASSIANFAYLAERFEAEISTGAKTVSQEGYLSDLAEGSLNAKVVATMGVAPKLNTRQPNSSRHEVGFEAVADAVVMLHASKRSAKNKISNIRR
ncbi:MAG: hypothetical protein AAGH38_11565 [Pseudomonadota bacterium]